MKNSGLRSFIDWAEQYRDAILLVLFFSSGLFWLYSAFATKAHVEEINSAIRSHVETIRCLNDLNRTLLESRLQIKILDDSLRDKYLEVAKIDEMGNLGPGDRTARRNLEDSIEDTRKVKDRYGEELDEMDRQLRSGKCGV